MQGKITQYMDKLGNKIFPTTKEKCIYDDNNVRLDNKLKNLSNQFHSLQGGIEIPENADLNSPAYRVVGNYYCISSAVAETIQNLPPGIQAAFTMHVFYGNGTNYPIQQIEFYYGSVINRRMFNPYTNTYDNWIKLLSTVDVINNQTTGGTDKVFSAEAGKVLGQEIDALNSNFNVLNMKIGVLLNGSILSVATSGIWYAGQGTTGKPINEPGFLAVAYGSSMNAVYIFIPNTTTFTIYRKTFTDGMESGWSTK